MCLCLCLLACADPHDGGTPGPPPPVPPAPEGVPLVDVCDGSQELVLSVALGPGALRNEGWLAENGIQFLYLRGDCWVWVSGDEYLLGGAYELEMTREQAQVVAATVGYSLWPERYGDYYADDVSDGSSTLYLDRRGLIRCYPECNHSSDDPVLRTMNLDNAIDLVLALGAEPVAREGRIVVGPSDQPDQVPDFPKRLLDLSALARRPGQEERPSDLLDRRKANDVREYIDSQRTRLRPRPRHFQQNAEKFSIYFRDALPIDTERGPAIPEWPEPGPL